MTEEEKRNVENAKRYIELYNTDIDRYVRECYTPDCTVYGMGAVAPANTEDWLKLEQAIHAAAPKRYMRLEHMHVSGAVVILEITLLDPDKGDDWSIPFVAVLTMRDGKIVLDRTYADFTNWPGRETFVNYG